MLAEEYQEKAIALFSEDGQHWSEQNGSSSPIEWEFDPRVTRIVIGSLDKDNNDPRGFTALPENFAEIYPNLTHLHIWRQEALKELPQLQAGLLGLDVRHCENLTKLPKLPDQLETLDLGACTSLRRTGVLPATLQRCYFNDCTSLKDIDIEHCASLIELDASHCSAIEDIDELPCSIMKLVLSSCPRLESVDGLEQFINLRHLNLSSCPSLTTLAEIPDGIQYLVLYNNEQLGYYKNQTLGPYDRGTEREPNVASRIYVRKVFGHEITPSAQAKLLFLGDGRVGKTTLSKALQWYTLSEEARQSGNYDSLKPDGNEPYTRDIRFDNWKTELSLDTVLADEVNLKAESSGLNAVFDSHGQCEGNIRMWDFAGQELYHQTHRIFAAEGSVFVLVWSVDTAAAVDSSKKDVSEEEWTEWNRQRSLDYWLEYIQSIRPDASITVVCTRCPDGEQISWKKRAPKCSKRFCEVKDFYIDSLNPGDLDDEDNELRQLIEHLRKECGTEAHRLGILQPAFYSVVRNQLDRWVANNISAQFDERVLLRGYSDWTADLKTLDPSIPLTTDHIEGVTGYLNDAGMLVRVGSGENSAVLIDQSWAASAIYKLLHRPPGGSTAEVCLFNIIRHGEGVFYLSQLDRVAEWNQITSQEEKHTLLEYMEQCGIIARILEPNQTRAGNDALYLATEKWLLPEYETVEKTLVRVYQHVRQTQGAEQLDFSFESRLISEFDFRKLMVLLAKPLGSHMLFFRNGLQVTDNISDPSWCFQLAWFTDEEGDFYGKVDASLATSKQLKDELASQFEALITSSEGPLHQKTLSVSGEDIHLAEIKLPYINTADRDVGISSAGSPYVEGVVNALIKKLRESGISEYWYKSLGEDDDKRTLKVMERLPLQKTLLLFVSPDYLHLDASDPAKKWFCMYELADAIKALGEGKLASGKVIVIYLSCPEEDPAFDLDGFIDQFKQTATDNLQALRSHFLQAAARETVAKVSINEDLASHYSAAIRSPSFDKFFKDNTRTGFYHVLDEQQRGFTELFERIKSELGSG